jgi:signal transduction histidine kinase
LGLPIVKSLAELHGGSITIASNEGEGTTIRIHLPRERVLQMPPEKMAAVA